MREAYAFAFKANPNELGVSELSEWFGEDHSPTHPSAPNRSELRQILGREPSLNPNSLKDSTESLKNEIRLELSEAIRAMRVQANENDAINRAMKVRGQVALKVGVALYSLGVEPSRVVDYLRIKGIGVDEFELYSLAYRFGLGRRRNAPGFWEIAEELGIDELLRKTGLAERVRAAFERKYRKMLARNQGKRPSTLAKQAFIEALKEVGIGP